MPCNPTSCRPNRCMGFVDGSRERCEIRPPDRCHCAHGGRHSRCRTLQRPTGTDSRTQPRQTRAESRRSVCSSRGAPFRHAAPRDGPCGRRTARGAVAVAPIYSCNSTHLAAGRPNARTFIVGPDGGRREIWPSAVRSPTPRAL